MFKKFIEIIKNKEKTLTLFTDKSFNCYNSNYFKVLNKTTKNKKLQVAVLNLENINEYIEINQAITELKTYGKVINLNNNLFLIVLKYAENFYNFCLFFPKLSYAETIKKRNETLETALSRIKIEAAKEQIIKQTLIYNKISV